MPNYSTNKLIISGSANELKKFEAENFNSKGNLSFAKAIPVPRYVKPMEIIYWRCSNFLFNLFSTEQNGISENALQREKISC